MALYNENPGNSETGPNETTSPRSSPKITSAPNERTFVDKNLGIPVDVSQGLKNFVKDLENFSAIFKDQDFISIFTGLKSNLKEANRGLDSLKGALDDDDIRYFQSEMREAGEKYKSLAEFLEDRVSTDARSAKALDSGIKAIIQAHSEQLAKIDQANLETEFINIAAARARLQLSNRIKTLEGLEEKQSLSKSQQVELKRARAYAKEITLKEETHKQEVESKKRQERFSKLTGVSRSLNTLGFKGISSALDEYQSFVGKSGNLYGLVENLTSKGSAAAIASTVEGATLAAAFVVSNPYILALGIAFYGLAKAVDTAKGTVGSLDKTLLGFGIGIRNLTANIVDKIANFGRSGPSLSTTRGNIGAMVAQSQTFKTTGFGLLPLNNVLRNLTAVGAGSGIEPFLAASISSSMYRTGRFDTKSLTSLAKQILSGSTNRSYIDEGLAAQIGAGILASNRNITSGDKNLGMYMNMADLLVGRGIIGKGEVGSVNRSLMNMGPEQAYTLAEVLRQSGGLRGSSSQIATEIITGNASASTLSSLNRYIQSQSAMGVDTLLTLSGLNRSLGLGLSNNQVGQIAAAGGNMEAMLAVVKENNETPKEMLKVLQDINKGIKALYREDSTTNPSKTVFDMYFAV